MSNSNKPIKFSHLRKLAKQLMLTGAFMIEVTQTITVNFMKAKILLVAQWRENCVNWKKIKGRWKNIFFKTPINLA